MSSDWKVNDDISTITGEYKVPQTSLNLIDSQRSTVPEDLLFSNEVSDFPGMKSLMYENSEASILDVISEHPQLGNPFLEQPQPLRESLDTSPSSMSSSSKVDSYSPTSRAVRRLRSPETPGKNAIKDRAISHARNSNSGHLVSSMRVTVESGFRDDGFSESFKRSRAARESDPLYACWNSPLCPNHRTEGMNPNPVTCGGECAPFIFDDFPQPENTNFTSVDESSSSTSSISRRTSQSRAILRITTDIPGCDTKVNISGAPSSNKSKRKISEQKNDLKDSISSEISEVPSRPLAKSGGRVPHNQVEKKYRESLNAQLEALRRVLPNFNQGTSSFNDADIEDLPIPSKPSKAVILAGATAYIKKIEREKKELDEEIALLRMRNNALLSLVKCEDCSLMQYVAGMTLQGSI